MTLQAPALYSQPSAPMRTARHAEYEVIARITQKLVAANNQRHEKRPQFLEALLRNETLWSTLAADVASAGNPLPQSLRARLFYLYRFTVAHSRLVRENGASVGVLIDINTAVLKGLRGSGEAE